MARRKLTRRELVQKDEITSTLERATDFVIEHGKVLAIGVGVVIVVVALVVAMNVTARNRQASAQSALADVIRVYSTIIESGTDEDRFQATVVEAARVQADHPDQPAAQIARYYAALAHEGLGDSAEAIVILSELSDSEDQTVNQVARFALAESYKNQGELESAVGVYQELSEAGGYSQGAVLYELGRIHEAMSMPDQARDYYQSLVGEYPTSPFREDADRALRRLNLVEAPEEPS